jgi:hypothetical protein
VSDQLSHPYKTTGNETVITKFDNGNSVVIPPTEHYGIKIQNFITASHFQTINADPTKLFEIKSERQKTTENTYTTPFRVEIRKHKPLCPYHKISQT